MKVSIVFHSLCGNTYLIAKMFYESFLEHSRNTFIYRTEDPDLEKMSGIFPAAKEYLKDILTIPIAKPENVLQSDIVILGSPTYFGNVSAEMKSFMDDTAVYYGKAELAGKILIAFTSAGMPEGGGNLCLRAINTYGQHMGMITIPPPANIFHTKSISAYGVICYSGPKSDIRINLDAKNNIIAYVDFITHRVIN